VDRKLCTKNLPQGELVFEVHSCHRTVSTASKTHSKKTGHNHLPFVNRGSGSFRKNDFRSDETTFNSWNLSSFSMSAPSGPFVLSSSCRAARVPLLPGTRYIPVKDRPRSSTTRQHSSTTNGMNCGKGKVTFTCQLGVNKRPLRTVHSELDG